MFSRKKKNKKILIVFNNKYILENYKIHYLFSNNSNFDTEILDLNNLR